VVCGNMMPRDCSNSSETLGSHYRSAHMLQSPAIWEMMP
jgi:hypothetical protein